MTITWPNNTVEKIDEIRDAIGRDLTIMVTVSGIACTASGCSLDPVTGFSTNPFCPVCSGKYYMNTTSGFTVTAHCVSKRLDEPIWTTGGLVVEGVARAQFKYTPSAIWAVENASHYIMDGKKHFADSVSLRGVPDINRIVVTFEEQDKDG
jgi:hypothetical protein